MVAAIHLLVCGNGYELYSFFGVDPSACRTTAVEILLDVMPAEPTNLRCSKCILLETIIRCCPLSTAQKKSIALYLIATWTRAKVSVRDVQLFHAEGAVKIFFVRHHD
jgi:hypothetical protein